MTLQKYVSDVLQIPVTIVGFNYTVEAIEIVLDTQDYRFYPKLSEVTGQTTRYLEKALRTAKDKSLQYTDDLIRATFLNSKIALTNTNFIMIAAQLYKEEYEDKEAG